MILKSVKGEKGITVIEDLRKLDKAPELNKENEYCHQLPALPEWCSREYASAGIRYNPALMKCTCGEREEPGYEYSGRDIRLLCKHLTRKILSPAVRKSLDDLTLLLIERQFKHGREKLIKIENEGAFYLLGYGKNTEWVNVYVQEKAWRRFAYNYKEKRWAYNSVPSGVFL